MLGFPFSSVITLWRPTSPSLLSSSKHKNTSSLDENHKKEENRVEGNLIEEKKYQRKINLIKKKCNILKFIHKK